LTGALLQATLMLDKGLNVQISGIDVAERVPGPPCAWRIEPTYGSKANS
jgi:hypothetical protein